MDTDQLTSAPYPDAPLYPFVLSHQRVRSRDHCHKVTIRGRPIYLCSRCSGIAIGFPLLLILQLFGVVDWLTRWPALFLLAFPLFGVADWSVARLGWLDTGNLVRTATGLLLGAAQAAAYCVFVTEPTNLYLWLSVGIYSSMVIAVFFVTRGDAEGGRT